MAVGVGSWFFGGLFDFSDVFVFDVGGAGSGDFVDDLGLSDGAGTSVWFFYAEAQGDCYRTSEVGWNVFVGQLVVDEVLKGFEAFWIGVHEVLGVSEAFAVGAWGCCVGCLFVDEFLELVGLISNQWNKK